MTPLASRAALAKELGKETSKRNIVVYHVDARQCEALSSKLPPDNEAERFSARIDREHDFPEREPCVVLYKGLEIVARILAIHFEAT